MRMWCERDGLLVVMAIMSAMLLGVTARAEAPREGLTFYAGFDQGLDADVATGGGKAMVQGRMTRYVSSSGKSGGAACVNAADRELKYALPGNLTSGQGTVAMFVCVEKGSLTDPNTIVFFDAFKDKSMLVLYKHHTTPKQIQMVTQTQVNTPGSVACRVNDVDWSAGQWHHLAMTWDANEIAVFIDGQEAKVLQLDKPLTELGEYFFVGGSMHRWGQLPQQANLLVDDLRIYNRVLSAEEIKSVVDNAARTESRE
ncbi:MAG: LamG domain-containing protein [Phycisphaeraceae bacterium]|nr:LamG domain-containing protein [Phycisphaeraceae bacterium]